MGHGMECSLRFFLDGSTLRPTGLIVRAGYSGDRLRNVMGMAADLGFLCEEDGHRMLTDRGREILIDLGGPDDA